MTIIADIRIYLNSATGTPHAALHIAQTCSAAPVPGSKPG